MAEVDFDPTELKNLKRIGIKYEDSAGKSHIIDTNVIFLSDNNITVSYTGGVSLDINRQKNIELKYVANNLLCNAETTLIDMKKGNGLIYLVINYPKTVTQINRRKYFRISSHCPCVLICTDEKAIAKDLYLD